MIEYSPKGYEQLRNEVLDWLPKRIINAHVHTASGVRKEKEHLLDKSVLNKKLLLNGLSYNEKVYENVFPGRQISAVGFPLPFKKVGIEADHVNRLLIKEMKYGVHGVMMASLDVGLLEDLSKEAEKNGVEFRGLKFHPWLFGETPKEKITIDGYFSDELLDFAERKNMTLICELPNGLNKKDLRTLEKVHDNYSFRILIPHLGLNNLGFITDKEEFARNLHASYDEFRDHFMELKEFDRVYLDTAMITDARLLRASFEEFPDDRLLWGDDYPFCLTQKISDYRPSKKEMGDALYRITNDIKGEDDWKYLYNIYQQVGMIKMVVEEGSFDKGFKDNLFSRNAENVYNLKQ